MRKSFGFLAVPVLICLFAFSVVYPIQAESNYIIFQEIIQNDPLVDEEEDVKSFVFNDEDIDISTVTELTAKHRLDVPKGVPNIIPEGTHGNIFHFYQIRYRNGNKVIGHESTLKIDDIENINEVEYITFFYTYSGKIRVNRYVDSVAESNLLHSKDNYGRVAVDLLLNDGNKLTYDAHKLGIDPYVWDDETTISPLEYEYVESNVDLEDNFSLEDELSFDMNKTFEINVIYKKVESKSTGIANIVFKTTNGEVLHTETLNGNVGEKFEILKDYFINKSGYELVKAPQEIFGHFAKEVQEYVFVFSRVDNEKPGLGGTLTPQEETKPSEEEKHENNDIDNTVDEEELTQVDTGTLPNTGQSANVMPFALVGLGSVLTMLKKRKN